MGWPNQDPEGWDKVCRDAVAEWLEAEKEIWDGTDYNSYDSNISELVNMLQSEHRDIFDALLLKVPSDLLHAHEADYLMR